MTMTVPTETLLANLDRVVQETLAYFAGAGRGRRPGLPTGRRATS